MEWSNMKRREALLSAGTILSILAVLVSGAPASASPAAGTTSDLSDQRGRRTESLAQFRSKKDPEPDPGGLPGVRPDANPKSDSDVQRGYSIEREEYRAKRSIIPRDTIEKKPDGTKSDKPIQGIK
jgi:hypothetical protein